MGLDRFSALNLTCTDEFFFEALASNIKGSVISFQTFTKRLANLKQSRIVQRLNVLKESYVINQDEIATLENELNSIVNAEVLIKVKSMKLFSCINSEKPTPIFLSLARASNSSSRLENILDEQGSPFASPGRIAVLKTLLIPQLNYLGCFLTPEEDLLDTLQDIMDSFVLKGQSISKDRRYLPPELGGTGLFKLTDFLIAQKCSWVKRAYANQNDNWRLALTGAAPDGNLVNLRACDIPAQTSIVLHEIAWAFEYFSGCYSLLSNNYKKTVSSKMLRYVGRPPIVGCLTLIFLEKHSITTTEA